MGDVLQCLAFHHPTPIRVIGAHYSPQMTLRREKNHSSGPSETKPELCTKLPSQPRPRARAECAEAAVGNSTERQCLRSRNLEALRKHGRIPNILDRLSGVYCGRLTRYAMLPGGVCSCLLSVATI